MGPRPRRRSIRRFVTALPLACTLVVAASAGARAAGPVAAERLVRLTDAGEQHCEPPTDPFCSLVGPGGPFDYAVESALSGPLAVFDAQESISHAGASQHSVIGPSLVSVQGAADAAGTNEVVWLPAGFWSTVSSTTARSFFSVTFEIDEPADFTLDGTVAGWSDPFFNPPFDLRIELIGPVGSIVRILCPFDPPPYPPCGPHSERHLGTLGPGTYTLEAVVDARGNAGQLGTL